MFNLSRYGIDWKAGDIYDGERKIRLSAIQLKALRLLVNARGEVVLKSAFHQAIWKGRFVADGSLSQTIFLLRKVLGKLPNGKEMIETVPKKGYRLAAAALGSATTPRAESERLMRSMGLGGDMPYRLLVESVQEYAIYMLDCSGRVLTWNRGAELNKGFASNEAMGQHYSLFFPAEAVEARAPERELAIAATEGHFSGEGWRIRKNGERFWASVTLTALRNSKGSLLGFAKVLKDLTERKRREDALLRMEAAARRERDHLRAAAESSLDALFLCEAVKDINGEVEDFVFTFLNRNVERIVNICSEELLGSRLGAVLPTHRELGPMEAYRKVFLTGEPYVAELPLHNGATAPRMMRLQAVRLEDGVAITVGGIGLACAPDSARNKQ